jgi:DNA helicase II / ATP-dependent DNA helicase PcrA
MSRPEQLPPELEAILLEGLTADQKTAVRSDKRRVLIVAGAGSGKTEVMARRIAWWVGIENVPRERIVAFTFTDRAAEEMKFRIRSWLERITPAGDDVALGGMYVGTIHGFCLAKVREFWPDEYHNYDILDEGSRSALILRGFNFLLGLQALRTALSTGQYPKGQYATLKSFVDAYDQLHEHDLFAVRMASDTPPQSLGEAESEWCKQAELITNVGDTAAALAFSRAAGRYYAYLRCRRFLDFSTSQTEFLKNLRADLPRLQALLHEQVWLVVDEVQDINPVQHQLMEILVGEAGKLTAVGDHRQAIYGFRGAKVQILGNLWQEFTGAHDAEVIDLRENFRSTPRIIDVANRWAATISPVSGMQSPAMTHGYKGRLDHHRSHVALVGFTDRAGESSWIAEAIKVLIPSDTEGALHDKKDGARRGLAFADVAILVRSSTDVRTYMTALEAAGIPCVVRAGPDLFSQPEVLFFVAAIAMTAGTPRFLGSDNNPKSLPCRIRTVLSSLPLPEDVLRSAGNALRTSGLALNAGIEDRVLAAAKAVHQRILENRILSRNEVEGFRTPRLRDFLSSTRPLRRVFPQQLYHMLLAEAEVEAWDIPGARGQAALFHLGALSGLVTGMETPGWTSVKDYPWQVIGLFQFGAEEARAEEQPLMVQPDAVTISTIHGVKGLEFAAVFLADVQPQRFPSAYASRVPNLPLAGPIIQQLDVVGLADNANRDGERRLLYVAITRAERFFFLSHSGGKTSQFVKEMRDVIKNSGGLVTDNSQQILEELKYAPKEHRRDIRLSTSFSDLRYYLECPHDFYLRKVLGFAPTIDQAFGYGRGVHNLMRAIHADPKKWAALCDKPGAVEQELSGLIDRGLFYLRYTTGEPAENMRAKGLRIVADYIRKYRIELDRLTFEPEKDFETLIEYEDGSGGALIAGAIDIIRQDDPPRVTLIDFKSGDPDSDRHQKLDEEEMQLQVALYAIAAAKELEYQPERGLVRYLDAADPATAELNVPLNSEALIAAKRTVAETALSIRERRFRYGPSPSKGGVLRCTGCDFLGLCGMPEAVDFKRQNGW